VTWYVAADISEAEREDLSVAEAEIAADLSADDRFEEGIIEISTEADVTPRAVRLVPARGWWRRRARVQRSA